MLNSRYDFAPEPDEPQQVEVYQDQDDLYDEDQFYRESEAFPPAPKLSSDLSKTSKTDIPLIEPPSSSSGPPIRHRDGGHTLEGKLQILLAKVLSILISTQNHNS